MRRTEHALMGDKIDVCMECTQLVSRAKRAGGCRNGRERNVDVGESLHGSVV